MTFSYKLARRLALNGVALVAVLGAAGCSQDLPSDPGSPDAPSGASSFSIKAGTPIGARIQTIDIANIRSAATVNSTLLGTQPKGALGTIVGGPVTDTNGDKLIRYQIDFDSGVDGWAAQDYLTNSTAPAPVTTVATVTVSPATATVPSKGTVQLAAVAKDANGNTLSGQTFTWASGNPSVATVSSTGLVTDVADGGPVTITATAGGKVGSATITIPPATSGVIAIGGRVKTTDIANIRNAPAASGTLLGTQPAGALGTVVAGPITDASGDGLIRWQINFDSGVDGWAAQDYLASAAPVSTGPVATVTVSPNPASVSVGSTLQLSAVAKDASGATVSGAAKQ